MIRCTSARVDLDAIRRNYCALAAHLDAEAGRNRDAGAGPAVPPGIIAVVKANAYGHGAVPVAGALAEAGARWLAVADIEEGLELREAGVSGRILVFGALSVSDLSGLFTHQLTPTVSSPAAARSLAAAAAARQTRLACHLKIDTGLNRLGFRFDNLARTVPEVLASPFLEVEALSTHFATADDAEDPAFEAQRLRFEAARETVRALGGTARWAHAANSAASLRDSRTWADFIRPGLLLYGLVPAPLATTVALAPAMTLTSRVVAVKGVRAGGRIGYGGRHEAATAMSIAVVPAGYADGLDRRLEGRGAALIRGRRAPIVGAVSMDMLTVDVTGIDGVSTGDEVVFLGSQGAESWQTIDAREMAAWIGTIPYEVLCRLGTRVARRYA
ncbi:MAG: alanine racemase [Vicinamibacterales bacterium]